MYNKHNHKIFFFGKSKKQEMSIKKGVLLVLYLIQSIFGEISYEIYINGLNNNTELEGLLVGLNGNTEAFEIKESLSLINTDNVGNLLRLFIVSRNNIPINVNTCKVNNSLANVSNDIIFEYKSDNKYGCQILDCNFIDNSINTYEQQPW